MIILFLALGDPTVPFNVTTYRPDGTSVSVTVSIEGYTPFPPKSPFREWADGVARFLVETSETTPDVLILSLYDAKLRQIGIRWPRQQAEPEEGR